MGKVKQIYIVMQEHEDTSFGEIIPLKAFYSYEKALEYITNIIEDESQGFYVDSVELTEE